MLLDEAVYIVEWNGKNWGKISKHESRVNAVCLYITSQNLVNHSQKSKPRNQGCSDQIRREVSF